MAKVADDGPKMEEKRKEGLIEISKVADDGPKMQEKRKEELIEMAKVGRKEKLIEIAKVAGAVVVGVVVVGGLVAWGMASLFSSESSIDDTDDDKKKMMKAPGRDGIMPRDDFAKNTADYFKKLREDDKLRKARGKDASLFSSESSIEENDEEEKEMMKAPGRDGRILRDDFEKKPADYFRELHKDRKLRKH